MVLAVLADRRGDPLDGGVQPGLASAFGGEEGGEATTTSRAQDFEGGGISDRDGWRCSLPYGDGEVVDEGAGQGGEVFVGVAGRSVMVP